MSNEDEYQKIINDALINGVGLSSHRFANGELVVKCITAEEAFDITKHVATNKVSLNSATLDELDIRKSLAFDKPERKTLGETKHWGDS